MELLRIATLRISAGRVHEFYESVFAELLSEGRISFQAVHVDPGCWYEVDTAEDLHNAEMIFR